MNKVPLGSDSDKPLFQHLIVCYSIINYQHKGNRQWINSFSRLKIGKPNEESISILVILWVKGFYKNHVLRCVVTRGCYIYSSISKSLPEFLSVSDSITLGKTLFLKLICACLVLVLLFKHNTIICLSNLGMKGRVNKKVCVFHLRYKPLSHHSISTK